MTQPHHIEGDPATISLLAEAMVDNRRLRRRKKVKEDDSREKRVSAALPAVGAHVRSVLLPALAQEVCDGTLSNQVLVIQGSLLDGLPVSVDVFIETVGDAMPGMSMGYGIPWGDGGTQEVSGSQETSGLVLLFSLSAEVWKAASEEANRTLSGDVVNLPGVGGS